MRSEDADFVHCLANALQTSVCDTSTSPSSLARTLKLVRDTSDVGEPAASLCVAMLLGIASRSTVSRECGESWIAQWVDSLSRRDLVKAADLLEEAFAGASTNELVGTVREHIRRHYADPDLAIAITAKALGVSR